LLAFFLAAVVVLAYLLPKLFLHSLAGSRPARQMAQRDDEVSFLVLVRSLGRWKSRYVVLEDENPSAFPDQRHAHSFVEAIGRGAGTEVAYTRKMYCRGVFKVGPCVAKCAFPFGLIETVRRLSDTTTAMVVLPRIWPMSRFLLAGLNPYRRDTRRDKRGVDDEFVGVREYTAGDERRHVHWRSSAKLGRLVIREFQSYSSGSLFVVVDFNRSAHCGTGVHSTFEYMMEIVASIGAAAHGERQQVEFFGWRGTPWHCKVSGLGDLNAFLVELAHVNSDGIVPLKDVLRRLGTRLQPQDRVLVLLTNTGKAGDLATLAEFASVGISVECIELQAETFDDKVSKRPVLSLPGVRTRSIRGDADLAPQLLSP
jgi:uncharacterized protein (DUF58 family)